ncbi:MAG: hypothetical protein J6B22_04150 [Clostridia bacterium]|nr:hypothetical protein [Clostridia bacterium]
MNKNIKMNIFSIIMIVLLILVNLVHLIWSFWLISEQIKTGFGFGTNMEIGVLYPWITEILCSPILISGIVYLIISIFKRPQKSLLITNIILFSIAVLQYVITNLFIWF